MTTTTLRLQQRKGTDTQWSGTNPTLGDGEFGYSTTDNVLKIGNGLTTWNSLPSFLTTAGGTLVGALTLSGAPSSNLHAATKLYVDTKISDLIASAPGTLDTLKEIADVLGTPGDITGSLISNINAKLPLSGGTLTGFLTLSAAPTANLHAATKLYVDSKTYALDDISDVYLTTSPGPTTGQILAYDSTLNSNSGGWKNLSLDLSSSYQPLDPDLTAIAGLTGPTYGFLKKTADNTWSIDASTYATLNANTFLGTQTLTTGTTTSPPIKFQVGLNTTSPISGSVEYDGSIVSITPNTSIGRAPIATPIFTSGIGTSATVAATLYSIFPSSNDTITLPVGVYKIELSFQISSSTATTPLSVSLGIKGATTGAGTAAGSITWDGTATTGGNGVSATQYQNAAVTFTTGTTPSFIISPSTGTSSARIHRGTGILKITTAGTITPSYSVSALSGTFTLVADNYLIITPLSSSGTAVSTGAWA